MKPALRLMANRCVTAERLSSPRSGRGLSSARSDPVPGLPGAVVPLPRVWYDRSTTQVARELLGTFLVVRGPHESRVARLVETEAYVAGDAANHAFRGLTARNRSMFGPSGTLYVYRIHQVHCANIVTRPGQAVLLRAAESVAPPGLDLRGPGKLCRELGIGRSDDGSDVTSSRIMVISGTTRSERIVRARRVGVRLDAERPLRFAFANNRFVSSPRPH